MGFEQSFVTSRHGDRLACSSSFPDGDRLVPLAVLSHGLASKRFNVINVALAERLTGHGIAIVVADLSAHGDSTGDMLDQSVVRAGEDVADIVHAAVADDRVNPDYVGLLGNSFSGNGAILEAADLPISCLALKAPVLDFEQTVRHSASESDMLHWQQEGRTSILGVTMSWEAVDVSRRVDSYEALDRIGVPVSVWQGSADEVIPAEQWQKLQAACERPGRDFSLLEGANHRIDPPHFDALVDGLEQFFVQNLH